MTRPTQIALVVLISLAVVAALLSRPAPPRASTDSAPPAVAAAGAPQLPRFVEVGAHECVPCKMMQPVLDELRKEYSGRLEIEFADVWQDQSLGEKYGVRSIPTQIIYDASGKEVFRHEGYWPKEDIDAQLKKLSLVG